MSLQIPDVYSPPILRIMARLFRMLSCGDLALRIPIEERDRESFLCLLCAAFNHLNQRQYDKLLSCGKSGNVHIHEICAMISQGWSSRRQFRDEWVRVSRLFFYKSNFLMRCLVRERRTLQARGRANLEQFEAR